jgi:hypothetical protein
MRKVTLADLTPEQFNKAVRELAYERSCQRKKNYDYEVWSEAGKRLGWPNIKAGFQERKALAAEIHWGKVHAQAEADWRTAQRRLADVGNFNPTQEEIRRVAQLVHDIRVQWQMDADWHNADETIRRTGSVWVNE